MRTLIAYLLLVSSLLTLSCSKKDDAKPVTPTTPTTTPGPSLDEVSLSFASSTQVVDIPAAMKASPDTLAKKASSWINSVNDFIVLFVYMKPPANATKSTTPIVATNGRAGAVVDVLVYTWINSSGTTIGYQISETADNYVFEVFFILSGKTNWLKYAHGEEKKDKSSGSMALFDIFGVLGADKSATWVDYAWSRGNDILTFNMNNHGGFAVKVIVNEKTKLGIVDYVLQGVKEYEMSWTATGSGSWTLYNGNGTVNKAGSWAI